MFKRSTPDLDYLSRDLLDAFGTCQIVRTPTHLHVSGIAPLKGGLDSIRVIGEGDLRAQLRCCIETLRRCLEAEGADLCNVVAYTLYVTDIDGLLQAGDIFREHFGAHPPASTWIEVRRLLVAGQMVELLPVIELAAP